MVPVEKRQEYMKAIQKVSVKGKITDFTRFIASLITKKKRDSFLRCKDLM